MVRECFKKEIDPKIIATAISLCDKPKYLILNQDTVDALEDLESVDSRVVGANKVVIMFKEVPIAIYDGLEFGQFEVI